MRILMIAPEPFFSPRGTPISVYHRLQTFSRLGAEVDLLTYHLGQDIDIQGVHIFRIMRLPLVRRVKVGPSYIKPLLDVLLCLKAMAMLSTNRYDVIHAHEEAAYFSVLLADLFGAKLLYDMHSSLPQQLSNYGFARYPFLKMLFARLERSVIRRAEVIITICQDLQRHVNRFNGGGKPFLIENSAVGEPIEDVDRLAVLLRERWNLRGKRLVVYTGTFEHNQGLELLVSGAAKVMSSFPQTVYVFVGGRPDQVDRLHRLALQLGVDQHFLFPGQRPMNEIPVYLAAADILVSPRSEGTNTPLKIYSYLAAEKPIVATDLETHRQVLDEETALLVSPTAEGLAGGICQLMANRSRREKLIQGVRRLVREKYSYRSYVEKTQQVLAYLESR